MNQSEFNTIAEAACRKCGIRYEDLFLKNRRRHAMKSRPVVAAREEIIHALRCHRLSYPKIGRLLRIDHSTAILAERRYLARNLVSKPVSNETPIDTPAEAVGVVRA